MKLQNAPLVAAVLFVSLIMTACASQKVRIQQNDKLYIAEEPTGLIAGIRRVDDLRPDIEKQSDENNERPRQIVVNEQLYKTLKLSGLFQNVLFEKFSEDQVDVVVAPKLKSFTSRDAWTAMTAAAIGIAAVPLVNLIYLAGNGPVIDYRATVAIDLEFKYMQTVTTVSASKDSTITLGLRDDARLRAGQLEGDVLSDVIHDLANQMAATIRVMKK